MVCSAETSTHLPLYTKMANPLSLQKPSYIHSSQTLFHYCSSPATFTLACFYQPTALSNKIDYTLYQQLRLYHSLSVPFLLCLEPLALEQLTQFLWGIIHSEKQCVFIADSVLSAEPPTIVPHYLSLSCVLRSVGRNLACPSALDTKTSLVKNL